MPEESTAGPKNPLVTSVASMGKQVDGPFVLKGGQSCGGADGPSTRSALSLVLSITKRSVSGLGCSKTLVSLVESLVWPFVARRSLKRVWFTQKELDRFVHSMRKTAVNIQKHASDENGEQSYIKYWTDRYLCQAFSDTKRPDSFPVGDGMEKVPLFVGWCKLFIVRHLRMGDISFFYSLQKGVRKMWPKLGEAKELAALAKHKRRLNEFKGFIGDQLQEQIQFVSGEVLRFASKTQTKFMPSGSACSQANRRKGGALSLTSRLVPPSDDLQKSLGKLRALNLVVNEWRSKEFEKAYQHVVSNLSTLDEHGGHALLAVDVMAIPEPGKFRIITKGDGYLYSVLQPLQGQMLDAWKKHPASTMRDEDLSDRIRLMDRLDFPFWISVDYEAATDLLKRDATYAAFRPWADQPFGDLGWYSLGPGSLRYPDGGYAEGVEGQYMGHPLSFVLLCIINLAVYRRSVEIWVDRDRKQRLRLMDSMQESVIVNGDDMLFKGDMELFEIFSQVSAEAGFKKSQGKNYVSPHSCMINSQVFRRVNGVMKRFGYLNMKLVTGVSLKSGDSRATPTQIAKELSKMVSRCLWTNCSIPYAMSRWNKEWFGVRYRPNWYLPVCLGGFGLDPKYGPAEIHVTRDQRLLAARFSADPRLALYRSGVAKSVLQKCGAAGWRLVVGDYVQRDEEMSVSDASAGWLERLAYASRAIEGAKEVSDAQIMTWIFRREYRLRPMSIEGIERYFYARLIAYKTPVCPPISTIRPKMLWMA